MNPKKRIGEMLLEAGIIDETQLKAALGHQRQWGMRLGQALVDLKLATEPDIVRTLSLKFGFDVAKLDALEPYGHEQALKLFPPEFVTRNNVFPMWADTANVTVAMSDPSNLALVDEIRFRTGRRVKVCIGGDQEVAEAVKRSYPAEGGVEAIALDLDADGEQGIAGEAMFDPFGGGSKDALQAFFEGTAEGQPEGEAAARPSPEAPPAAAAAPAPSSPAAALPAGPARPAPQHPQQEAARGPAKTASGPPAQQPGATARPAVAAVPARPAAVAAPAPRPAAPAAPRSAPAPAAAPRPAGPGPAAAAVRPSAPQPAARLAPAPPAAAARPAPTQPAARPAPAQPAARPGLAQPTARAAVPQPGAGARRPELELEDRSPPRGEPVLATDLAPGEAEGEPESRELTERELAILESLDRLAGGAPAEPDVVKPAQAMAALIRLLIRKRIVSEQDFLDELSKK
jgi:hypothetical protein